MNITVRGIIALLLIVSSLQGRQIPIRDRLLPVPVDGGFSMEGYWIWCGSVIKGEDNKFHMFASRWPNNLSFNPHWLSNSEVVHAISETAEGPYRFYEVVLPPRGEQYWDGRMTHNPTIRKVDSTYLLYYTGTTYHGETPTPDHPLAVESPMKLEAHRNERIGLATATSVYGPWTRLDHPILDTQPDSWDKFLVSNAAPVVLPDKSIYLFYKGVEQLRKHAIGLAVAKSYDDPYVKDSDNPFSFGMDAEDPFIWFEDSTYHALLLDTGKKYSKKEIYYAFSPDLRHWTIPSNPIAISKKLLWSDGTERILNNTERPQVLVQNGHATHVFIAIMEMVRGKRISRNICVPLKP